MKVITATRKTQRARLDDISITPEGELVTWGPECGAEDIDAPCGCRRFMWGIDSHCPTTTFEVTDDPAITPEILASKIEDYLVAGKCTESEADALPWAREYVERMQRLICMFDVGTILERRGDTFSVRQQAPRIC